MWFLSHRSIALDICALAVSRSWEIFSVMARLFWK